MKIHHSILDKDYKFNKWVPKEAISCIKELRHNQELKEEDFKFLTPIFDSDDMKQFFKTFKDADRFFYFDLFYPFLVARNDLFRRQERHEEGLLLKSEIKSLENQIKNMRKTIDKIVKSKYHNVNLFFKFDKILNELNNYKDFLSKQIEYRQSIKNPYRPTNRKTLKKAKTSQNENIITAHYCARWLIQFFPNYADITLKKIEKKKIICDMINTLIYLPSPLTSKDLDDLKKNG